MYDFKDDGPGGPKNATLDRPGQDGGQASPERPGGQDGGQASPERPGGQDGGQADQAGAWLTCRRCVALVYTFAGPRAAWLTEYSYCQAFARMLCVKAGDDLDAVHWCLCGVSEGGE